MSLLENIQVFVRVVELGSLSAAGRHMRLSPAVCSQRVLSLERHLGLRLFNRTTRQMQPTEQGLVYYEGCLEVVRALEAAESAVVGAGGAPKGELRVTAPLGLGQEVIAPAVLAFRRNYPDIRVRLRMSEHLVDVLKEGLDAAIRLGPMPDSSLTMRKIAECERCLVAAPDYVARRGAPAEPADLERHECLLLRFPGSQQFRWTLDGPGGLHKLSLTGELDSDHGAVLLDWALAGQGVLMKPLFEVAAHLRAGRLVPVLPEWTPEPATLGILYPHRQMVAPKVRLFADFMQGELASAVESMRDGLSLEAIRGGALAQLPR